MIETYIDAGKPLTTHTRIAKITFEDLVAAIKKFYGIEPTDHNLWNMLLDKKEARLQSSAQMS